MPWKVVWLPFGEVPGRKQILDWWAVELVQACSFPSTIFHIRMSCYATLILGKNHSRDNLIVCRISGCEDIDLPLQFFKSRIQVRSVPMSVWLNDNETVMSKDDEHESPWFHSRHLSEFHCVVWVGWLRFFPRMIDYDSIERFVSMHVKPGCIDYWPLVVLYDETIKRDSWSLLLCYSPDSVVWDD